MRKIELVICLLCAFALTGIGISAIAATLTDNQMEIARDLAHEKPDIMAAFVDKVASASSITVTEGTFTGIQFVRQYFKKQFEVEQEADSIKAEIERILETATTADELKTALLNYLQQ